MTDHRAHPGALTYRAAMAADPRFAPNRDQTDEILTWVESLNEVAWNACDHLDGACLAARALGLALRALEADRPATSAIWIRTALRSLAP